MDSRGKSPHEKKVALKIFLPDCSETKSAIFKNVGMRRNLQILKNERTNKAKQGGVTICRNYNLPRVTTSHLETDCSSTTHDHLSRQIDVVSSGSHPEVFIKVIIPTSSSLILLTTAR